MSVTKKRNIYRATNRRSLLGDTVGGLKKTKTSSDIKVGCKKQFNDIRTSSVTRSVGTGGCGGATRGTNFRRLGPLAVPLFLILPVLPLLPSRPRSPCSRCMSRAGALEGLADGASQGIKSNHTSPLGSMPLPPLPPLLMGPWSLGGRESKCLVRPLLGALQECLVLLLGLATTAPSSSIPAPEDGVAN